MLWSQLNYLKNSLNRKQRTSKVYNKNFIYLYYNYYFFNLFIAIYFTIRCIIGGIDFFLTFLTDLDSFHYSMNPQSRSYKILANVLKENVPKNRQKNVRQEAKDSANPEEENRKVTVLSNICLNSPQYHNKISPLRITLIQ